MTWKPFLRELAGEFLRGVCKLEEKSGADPGLRILTYHRVNDFHPDDRLSVRVEEFRAQMRHLAEHGYRTISLSDVAHRGPLPANPIVLTFDDGYADNYQYAMPVLKEFGFRAVVFVTVNLIGTDNRLPRYSESPDRDRLLTWEETSRLAESGWEIGSHTLTHPDLRTLSDADLRREVEESRRAPDGQLFESFCYPSGFYDGRVLRAVREAGYLSAVTTLPGANFSGDNLLTLHRTEISGFDNLNVFKMKLSGAFDFLHQIYQSLPKK